MNDFKVRFNGNIVLETNDREDAEARYFDLIAAAPGCECAIIAKAGEDEDCDEDGYLTIDAYSGSPSYRVRFVITSVESKDGMHRTYDLTAPTFDEAKDFAAITRMTYASGYSLMNFFEYGKGRPSSPEVIEVAAWAAALVEVV